MAKAQSMSFSDFFAPPFPREWHDCGLGQPQDLGEFMWRYCACGLQGDEAGKEAQIAALKQKFPNADITKERERADKWLVKSIPVYQAAIQRKEDTPEQAKEIEQLQGPLAEQIASYRQPPSFPNEWLRCRNDAQQNIGNYMWWYCVYGLKDENAKQSQIYNLNQRFPNDLVTAELQRADKWLAVSAPIYRAAIKRKEDTPAQKKEIDDLRGPLAYYIAQAREYEQKRSMRRAVAKKHIVAIATPPTLRLSPIKGEIPVSPASSRKFYYSGHPNDIVCLAPALEWNLYIDESGSGTDKDFSANGDGVIAGVLSCASDPLPKQPRLHASEDGTDAQFTAQDKVIEALVNHPRAGVLAVPTRAYKSPQGWSSMIGSFIDLVLRLLPLPKNGDKVKLNVIVEQHVPYSTGANFELLAQACSFQLMSAFPERSSRIDFSIATMDKNHPYDAYPDIVANTCWGGVHGKSVKSDRLTQSGWKGTCYLRLEPPENTAQELRKVLDCFAQGHALPEADWDRLLNATGLGGASGSLVGGVLAAIGTEAKHDRELWEKYLQHVNGHLDSKAINLYALERQLQWLKEYQPDDSSLPKRLELLWLTMNLADSNHRGKAIPTAEANAFKDKAKTLFAEDAPLVCHAYLHLSVSYTNAFDFAQARQAIAELRALCPKAVLPSATPPRPSGWWSALKTRFLHDKKEPVAPAPEPDNWLTAEDKRPYLPAVFGLQAFGQVLSTCGQHAAFAGDLEKAARYFDKAIEVFGRLSDQESGRRDASQTRAYLVNVLADDAACDRQKFDAVCQEYFGDKDMPRVAAALAVSSAPADKYRHHILLRLLAYGRLGGEVKDAYMGQEAEWAENADGHPWEMIEFYRAQLLPAGDPRRRERLQKALSIVEGAADAVLRVIAAVIAAAIMAEDGAAQAGGKPIREFYQETVAACVQSLPALTALGYADALKAQTERTLAPLELAQKVLPFNFH